VSLVLLFLPGNGISGSLAATESGSDTFSASGSVLVAGTLAATESGPDIFAATGGVVVAGSLAATEVGPDTFAATGTVSTPSVTGTLAATESGPDTFAATGTVGPEPVPSGLVTGGWAPEKRRRPKQREFERDQLRELIVQKLEPVAGPAEVVEEPEQVTVRPTAGPAISIPVPPAFDAAEVARMVAGALDQVRAIQARAEEGAAQERAAETVRVELERIRRRRRQDEEMLLLM